MRPEEKLIRMGERFSSAVNSKSKALAEEIWNDMKDVIEEMQK